MISVITPAYKAASSIEKAIRSVLDQNYPDFEHVIVDAASNDGTVEILKKYSHLKWVSEKDKGQSDAMNKGFKMAKGDIIVYLNADDEFMPHIFQKIADVFKKSAKPQNTMVITDLAIMDEKGNKIITKPSSSLENILDPDKLEFPYNPVSYFYHRNIQEQIGAFPELNLAMDYWFLLRAYALSSVIHLQEVGGIFHNYNNKTANNIQSEIECLNVLMEYVKTQKRFTFFLDSNWKRARDKKAIFLKESHR